MTSSMVMTLLEAIPETQSMKEIIDKLDLIKIKKTPLCSVEETAKRMRDKPQTGRKYLQKTCLIEDCYAKYTKIS